MIFQIEFIRYDDGVADPVVVARPNREFLTQDQADSCGRRLFGQEGAAEAVCFRILGDGKVVAQRFMNAG